MNLRFGWSASLLSSYILNSVINEQCFVTDAAETFWPGTEWMSENFYYLQESLVYHWSSPSLLKARSSTSFGNKTRVGGMGWTWSPKKTSYRQHQVMTLLWAIVLQNSVIVHIWKEDLQHVWEQPRHSYPGFQRFPCLFLWRERKLLVTVVSWVIVPLRISRSFLIGGIAITPRWLVNSVINQVTCLTAVNCMEVTITRGLLRRFAKKPLGPESVRHSLISGRLSKENNERQHLTWLTEAACCQCLLRTSNALCAFFSPKFVLRTIGIVNRIYY